MSEVMSAASARTVRRQPGDEPVTEELLLGDLLGFAGYLAEEGVEVDLARAELADAAVTDSERRALQAAARRAASQLGTESPLTSLLRSAAAEPSADESSGRANVA
jgi:hypothetical protein